MNGQISEETLVRMEGKIGRPIRRGLDKAMNEVMDQGESTETKPIQKPAPENVDCLSDSTRECLTD